MTRTPERTCVVCKAKKLKDQLFRFLVFSHSDLSRSDRDVRFDKDGKGSGRGFYICSAKCWDEAVKKKRKIRLGSDAKTAVNIGLPQKTFEEATEN